MQVNEIFMTAMALIDEMTSSGELDETSVAEYKAKTPYLISLLQSEIVGIENRFRKTEDWVYPTPIESLEDYLEIDDIKAATMLSYGLAAQLMMHEDTTLANFFESKYEELRSMFLKPTAAKKEAFTDVYDSKLNY